MCSSDLFDEVGNAGVKMHSQNEQEFSTHMQSFIPHITKTSHQSCLRGLWPAKDPQVHPIDHAAALEKLETLIDGYINNCQRYLHSFSTIQIEVPLFLCTPLSFLSLLNVFCHMGLNISWRECEQWGKLIAQCKKCDVCHHKPHAIVL